MTSRILTYDRAVKNLKCERTDMLPSGLEQDDNLCLSKEDLTALANAGASELAADLSGYDNKRLVPENKVSIAFPNECDVTIDSGLFPNETDIWTFSQSYSSDIKHKTDRGNSVRWSGRTDTLSKKMITRPVCTSYRSLALNAYNYYQRLALTYDKNSSMVSIKQPGYVEFVDYDNALPLGFIPLTYASGNKTATASGDTTLAKAVFSVKNLLIREKKMKKVTVVNNQPTMFDQIMVHYIDINGEQKTETVKGSGNSVEVTTSESVKITSTTTTIQSTGASSSADRKTLYFAYVTLSDGGTITVTEYTSSVTTEDLTVSVKVAPKDYASNMWDYAVADSQPGNGSSVWYTLSPSAKSITIPDGKNLYVRYNDTKVDTPFYICFSDSLSTVDYLFLSSSNVATVNYSNLVSGREYTVFFRMQ